ncbi:VIT domain-containing protein [Nonomuraea sp. NPDC059194]|uniref:VIT domain-containing protein n=1 Tax=Nonomuraea sp. NPDC059194 TaxID=3346764 RepID=UPI0036BB975D
MKIISLDPAECLPVPEAGMGALRTERGNLPLESVDVATRISGLIAGVEVAQGFHNPFGVTLEATYVFPLPDRAAVTRFTMEADDRLIEGVLKERGQARADYDRALAEGRRAALAEEDRPDVFTITVGNILPGERVTVRLTLSQPLPYEDGAATFRFPLVVAPRYIPGDPLDGAPAGGGVAPDTGAVPDASRITPPVLLPGFPHPVRLSLRADIDPAGLELRELASSLHVVQREGTTVELQPGERLDRDFILRMGFEASTALLLDGDGTFNLTVLPPALRERRTPRDVVLLLDRSGSMTGWKMVAARRAAARIVDTLTTDDRFAVLTFDSVVEQAFEGLREASDRNRYRAVEHLSRVDARGGTELLAPLQQAIALLTHPSAVETTTNPPTPVISPIPRASATPADPHTSPASGTPEISATPGDPHTPRASASSPSSPTAPGSPTPSGSNSPMSSATTAESGNAESSGGIVAGRTARAAGSATVPGDGQGARDRVVVLVTDGQVGNEDQILEQAGGALSAMRVHVVGIDRAVNAGFLGRLATLGAGRCELVESEDRLDAAMEQIHRRIGAPLVTDLSLKGLDVEPDTVTHLGSIFPGVPLTVSGRYRDGSSVTVHGLAGGTPWEETVPATVVDNPAIRAIWARAHLRDLEDRYAMGERDLEPRIVETSLTYGVLCRFTAYVAIDTHQVAEGAPEHRVIQPVEPPSGWEMPPMPPSASGMMFTAMVAAAPAAPPRPRPGQPAGPGLPRALPEPGASAPLGDAPGFGGSPTAQPSIDWMDDEQARGGPGDSTMGGTPSFSRRARPARGRVSPPQPVVRHELDLIRPQLVAELERLKTVLVDRRLYLADLGSRLAALSAYLGGHPELSALATELETAEHPDSDADALWTRAVEVLTRLVGGPTTGGHRTETTADHSAETTGGPSTEATRSRPFWKRS